LGDHSVDGLRIDLREIGCCWLRIGAGSKYGDELVDSGAMELVRPSFILQASNAFRPFFLYSRLHALFP
jgi:hypothetical protein